MARYDYDRGFRGGRQGTGGASRPGYEGAGYGRGGERDLGGYPYGVSIGREERDRADHGRYFGRVNRGYDREVYDAPYRRHPEQSPTAGGGGDRAMQRYLGRRGYDTGYTIQPNRGGGARRGSAPPAPGYDRGWSR